MCQSFLDHIHLILLQSSSFVRATISAVEDANNESIHSRHARDSDDLFDRIDHYIDVADAAVAEHSERISKMC